MEKEKFTVAGTEVLPGEHKEIRLHVGKLPSGTRINIYANVYRSVMPGPTVLVMAGMHGDEVNGVEIVRRAVEQKLFDRLQRGTAIVIPLLNIYGFLLFSREVPDGKDVNRSFPGSFKGSLASRVARTLTKKILPHIDFGIDFHTGGANRHNYPQIRYSSGDAYAFELAQQFKAPFVMKKAAISKSLRREAKKMGKPILVFEGGEALRLDGFSIDKALAGLENLLYAQNMLDQPSTIKHEIFHVPRSGWVRASVAGIFEWSKASGQFVVKNEPIGTIRDPYGLHEAVIHASKSGVIVGHNNSPVVNQGDALFNIGYDIEKLDV